MGCRQGATTLALLAAQGCTPPAAPAPPTNRTPIEATIEPKSMDGCAWARAQPQRLERLRRLGRLNHMLRVIDQVRRECPEVGVTLGELELDVLLDLGRVEQAEAAHRSLREADAWRQPLASAEARASRWASWQGAKWPGAPHWAEANAAQDRGDHEEAARRFTEGWQDSGAAVAAFGAGYNLDQLGRSAAAQRWMDRAYWALQRETGEPIELVVNEREGLHYTNVVVDLPFAVSSSTPPQWVALHPGHPTFTMQAAGHAGTGVLSADGRYYAIAGFGNLEIWDMATLHPIHRIEFANKSGLPNLAIYRDRLVVALRPTQTSDFDEIRLFDIASAKQLGAWSRGFFSDFAVSDDGWLVVAASDAKVLDLNRTPLRTHHSLPVKQTAWHVAIGARGRHVWVFDRETGPGRLTQFETGTGRQRCEVEVTGASGLTASFDGRFAYDDEVGLVDGDTCHVVIPSGLSQGVFSPDGTLLAARNPTEVQIFELPQARLLHTLDIATQVPMSFVSVDGLYVGGAVYDARTGGRRRALPELADPSNRRHTSAVLLARRATAEPRLAVTRFGQQPYDLWSLRTGRQTPWQGPEQEWTMVIPDGESVWSFDQHTLVVFDALLQTELQRSRSFSSQDTYRFDARRDAVVVANHRSLRWYDPTSLKMIRSIDSPGAGTRVTGRVLIGVDGQVAVVHPKGTFVLPPRAATFSPAPAGVDDVIGFGPEGELLVAAERSTLHELIVDAPDGKVLWSRPMPFAPSFGLPVGDDLVVGGADSFVYFPAGDAQRALTVEPRKGPAGIRLGEGSRPIGMPSTDGQLLAVDTGDYVVVYRGAAELFRIRPMETGAVVVSPQGRVERLGDPRQPFRCISGRYAFPYALCRERFEATQLMSRALDAPPPQQRAQPEMFE